MSTACLHLSIQIHKNRSLLTRVYIICFIFAFICRASEVVNSEATAHKLRKNLDETRKENERLKRELAIAATANNGVFTPAMKNQMRAMKDLVAATLDLFFGVLPKPFRRILISFKGDMETALRTVGRMLGAVAGLAFRTLQDGVEDEMGPKKDQVEL